MNNPEIGSTIVSGGLSINYHDYGQGDPVILIHGSGPGVSSWVNWRTNITELAKHNRVIAPDMLGFGYSDYPIDNHYDKDLWVKQILDLMKSLDITRASIVGNSFGGAIALAFALQNPSMVNKLVLMGSVGVAFPLTEGLDFAWGYTPSLDNMRHLMDLFAFNKELITDDLAQMRYEASIREGVQNQFSSMFPAPRQRWVDALASSEELIKKLPHETLVIHGRDDRIIPVEASIKLSLLIPNSQLHIFGQCGHWTQIEKRHQFNQLVCGFLAKQGT